MYSDNILGISKVRKPKDIAGLTNEGYSFTFHENGSLNAKAFYKDGKLEGETVLYDFFGNPITINTYKNGKLINVKNLKMKKIRRVYEKLLCVFILLLSITTFCPAEIRNKRI